MNLRLAKLLPLLLALTTAALLPQTLFAAEMGLRRQPSSAPTEDPTGARVIVRFKATSSLLSAKRVAQRMGPLNAGVMSQRLGLTLADGHLLDTRTEVVHGDTSLSSAQLAARLAADPDVESAWPDLRRHVLGVSTAPNDPLFPPFVNVNTQQLNPLTAPDYAQWYLQPPDSTSLTPTALSNISGINAQVAWNITTGSTNIIVADIDTGVRTDHPDLAADAATSQPSKLVTGYNFVSTGGVTGTGWGPGASDPGDYTSDNQCGAGVPGENSSWHGTQVAGLIGAQTDNNLGIASIGYNIQVLPVRALGACGGYDSDIIAGMLWAAGLALPSNDPSNVPTNPKPARVINLSLGGTGSCGVYGSYITQLINAGVTVVAAAGNDEGLAVTAPANCPGVIAVAGVRNVGTKVGYSDVGPQVTLAAPAGNCVNATGSCLFPMVTTTNSGVTTPVSYASIANLSSSAQTADLYTNSTNYSVGTSFATPLVSGTVALMLSVAPTLTPAQISTILQSTARPFPTSSAGATTTVPVCQAPSAATQDECICTTSTCGAGLLDAGLAVTAAQAYASPTASIAGNSSVASGGSITLDGSLSTAPNSETISYQWSITSGATLASITGSSTASTVTVATNSGASGGFTVQLTVTDSDGISASQSWPVTITTSPPTATIVPSASSAAVGTNISFDGSGSTAATGFTIKSYSWAITNGTSIAAASGSASGPTFTISTTGPGSVTVQLTGIDSAGVQASSSSTVTVTGSAPSSGGGGGAMSIGWLALLALALAVLWRAPGRAD